MEKTKLRSAYAQACGDIYGYLTSRCKEIQESIKRGELNEEFKNGCHLIMVDNQLFERLNHVFGQLNTANKVYSFQAMKHATSGSLRTGMCGPQLQLMEQSIPAAAVDDLRIRSPLHRPQEEPLSFAEPNILTRSGLESTNPESEKNANPECSPKRFRDLDTPL